MVDEIRVTVTCAEVAVSGSGTNKTTHNNDLWTTTEMIARPNVVPGRREAVYTGSIALPHMQAWSFAAGSNLVQWRVVATIDCPGPFDPVASAVFLMQPPNAVLDTP